MNFVSACGYALADQQKKQAMLALKAISKHWIWINILN